MNKMITGFLFLFSMMQAEMFYIECPRCHNGIVFDICEDQNPGCCDED